MEGPASSSKRSNSCVELLKNISLHVSGINIKNCQVEWGVCHTFVDLEERLSIAEAVEGTHRDLVQKRFWHRTTEQLYWQVLQLTAYRTNYTSIRVTAATVKGLQRSTGVFMYWCVIVLHDHVSDRVTANSLLTAPQTTVETEHFNVESGPFSNRKMWNLNSFQNKKTLQEGPVTLQGVGVMCSPYLCRVKHPRSYKTEQLTLAGVTQKHVWAYLRLAELSF